jgi:hypothetical protein
LLTGSEYHLVRGFSAPFLFKSFLRGDLAAQATFLKELQQTGAFSPNDILRVIGMNTIGDPLCTVAECAT